MIDLHCHLLPAIDDGAQTMDEALELARIAVADGITHSVMTPHVHPGRYENRLSNIEAACETFREALREAAIPLKISAGGEVRISAEIIDMLEQGSLPLMHSEEGEKTLLLEFPHDRIIPGTENLIVFLLEQGITPMVAHPERNKDVMRNPKAINPFVEAGCLLQLTAASVAGDFGRPPKKCAEQLLKVHAESILLATDAHNSQYRPPKLEPGRKAAEKLVGESTSWEMVTTRPAKITNLS
jgi:protein-tyrosine phosphatase